MSSYENEIKAAGEKKQNLLTKIDFSMMKYLWLANPLSGARKDSIPRFLRNIELLKNLSDNELRILAKYMHSRKFSEGEVVFRQSEIGIGFYFIYSGVIELYYGDHTVEYNGKSFLELDEFNYFGELALLQDNHPREATALSKTRSELIGIFRPDLDLLIENHPRIAAKLIQSMSLAIADRLFHLTIESTKIQRQLKVLEEKNANR